MEAREHDKALLLAQEAHTQDPTAPGPALLALELMREQPGRRIHRARLLAPGQCRT